MASNDGFIIDPWRVGAPISSASDTNKLLKVQKECTTQSKSCSQPRHRLTKPLDIPKDSASDHHPKLHPQSDSHNHITTDPYELERFEEIPLVIAFFTYFSYILLNLMGRLRDLLRYLGAEKHQMARESEKTRSFVPLYQEYEAFYTRNLYRRVRDCWNRPLCSAPAAECDVLERVSPDNGWSFEFTGRSRRCLNFGSYNYLGYAGSNTESAMLSRISQINEDCIRRLGLANGYAPRHEALGTSTLQTHLESIVAAFSGQEDAIVFPMGFATNSMNIPALVDRHCCVLSDELNHTSLILGMRLSGAHVRRFKHNDMRSLEHELRDAILTGHPRTRRPFHKILIVLEGIYSMEGSIVRLREVVALKKRYKAYLYLDEAHSIGALGRTGRGVVEYAGVDPRDVDVAMGTFTKSFASAGGYIAGSHALIQWIRAHSHQTAYAPGMSPVVCQQVISIISALMDPDPLSDGARRMRQLAWNTRYLRAALQRHGLIVYGHADSPVVPVIVFLPAKCPAFSRACLERGLAIVVVGFPATPLILSRARLCVSAAHTKEMLDKAITVLIEMSDSVRLRYSRLPLPVWVREDATHRSQDQLEDGMLLAHAKEGDTLGSQHFWQNALVRHI